MGRSSTKFGIVLLLLVVLLPRLTATAQNAIRVSGAVLDPAEKPVPRASVEFEANTGFRVTGSTASDGTFAIALPSAGSYSIHIEAAGFATVTQKVDLNAGSREVTLRLEHVAAAVQEVIVSGDVSAVSLTDPDPSQRVMVREELLDANPGRPGAPVSLPGLPIETASGGIKAPQYFVPGVAGDHGEPIAHYIAVGGFLLPNNLSANAHGNGYADPNIYIAAALGSVETDGGAFNVLEGNHALNLAATYVTRPQLSRFVTLTGDYRDVDLAVGFAPSNPATKAWLALEANYGNGLMETLEHRQQYKWNAQWIVSRAAHEISLLSIGYWGKSHEGNLVPVGLGLAVRDTIDPRQQDQTHTGIVAANDQWKVGDSDQVNLSGFFRTYNLALFSNFGEGLIRQSEFRTVEGGEAQEAHRFSPAIEAMAGLDYIEDDIHRDNLDHDLSDDPQVYGPFVKVLSNNITIREVAPTNVAAHANLGKHFQLYAGLRHEWIQLNNEDVLKPESSSNQWQSVDSPKGTLTWSPGNGPAHWLPAASFSIGQGFFTEDPRISVAASGSTASPIERSHSEQLVLEKEFSRTNVRVTLGRTTTTATLAKIDPDNGLAEDEGPGRLKYLTASAQHQFGFGLVQAVFS